MSKIRINKDKFKNKRKYKLITLTPIVCGVIFLTGCSIAPNTSISIPDEIYFHDPNNVNVSQSEMIESEAKTYDVTIICENIETLNRSEKDLIMVYDDMGYGRHLFYSESNIDTTFDMKNAVIKTEFLGDVEAKVELEENERAIIYIDYLTKTITVEKELVLTR